MSRTRGPKPSASRVSRVGLAGAGTLLTSLALLLLVLVETVLFDEIYRGLENSGCNLPIGGARTIYLLAAGAGAVAAAIVAIALAWRSVKHDRRGLLTATASALLAVALGISLSFMLDPAVDNGICTQSKLDRARLLAGANGTIAAAFTMYAGLWLLHRSIGRARQPVLRLTVAIATSLPFWVCTWWMYTVLGSED